MEKLLCKDCKYSKISLLSRIFFQYYTCTHPSAWYTPKPDMVTGRTREGYYRACNVERNFGSDCGTEGKHWVPKDTSKVFLYLKHK